MKSRLTAACKLLFLLLPAFSCNLPQIENQEPPEPKLDFSFRAADPNCTTQCRIIFQNHSFRIDAFEWDFGDGSPKSTLAQPEHIYAKPGAYSVKLSGTLGGAEFETVTRVVNVGQIPALSAAFEIEYAGDPETGTLIRFKNRSLNAGSYFWNFGDGHYSTRAEPVHTYFHPNFYTVTLITRNGDFADTATASINIGNNVGFLNKLDYFHQTGGYEPLVFNDLIRSWDGGFLVAGQDYVDGAYFLHKVWKFHKSGNFQWSITKSSTWLDETQAFSLFQLPDSTYLSAGYFASSLTTHLFLTRFNYLGQITTTGPKQDTSIIPILPQIDHRIVDAVFTDDGNMLISGYRYLDQNRLYTAKISTTTKTLLQLQQYPNHQNMIPTEMVRAANGNILLGASNNTESEIMILDQNGVLRYKTPLPTMKGPLALAGVGDYIFAASSNGRIAKLNANADVLWQKQFEDCSFSDIVPTSDGQLALTGIYAGNTILYLRADPLLGELLDQRAYGNYDAFNNDRGTRLLEDQDGGFVIIGRLEDKFFIMKIFR